MSSFDETVFKALSEVSGGENLRNFQEVLEGRGYDIDTLEKVEDFYYGMKLPTGHAEEQANKIEARLYKVYPERHLEGKYNNESVDKLHSIASNVKRSSKHLQVPFSYHSEIELSDFKDMEALIFDHSVVWGIIDQSKKIKLENPDMLQRRARDKVEGMAEELEDVLDDLDYDLQAVDGRRILDKGKIYEEVIRSLSRTTVVSWEKPLELIDNVLEYRNSGVNLDIRHPDDMLTEAGDYCTRNGYNKHYDYEFIDCLEEISRPLPISNKYKNKEHPSDSSHKEKSYDPEDAAIIEAAGEEYDKFAVITYDSDFKNNRDLKDLEKDVGSESVPLLPDCADFILKCLFEEDML